LKEGDRLVSAAVLEPEETSEETVPSDAEGATDAVQTEETSAPDQPES
jgi:hypothetical protein